MSRFNQFLRNTGERLALPKATRSSILVEIAADLEDLFQHYIEQGLSEDEAAAQAEEKVGMSDEALAELVRIHSDARGWTDRMERQIQPFWERTAMALIVLFFVVMAATDTHVKLLAHTTIFVWPIVGIVIALVAILAFQMLRLSNETNPRRLRESLVTPLFLGAASVLIGFLGAGIELYRTLIGMVVRPETATNMFAKTILEITSTLAISLLVALGAGVVWFVLAGRINRIEDRAASNFMEVP
jgi:hypothetical protein